MIEKDKKWLGERIKSLRKLAGMTQGELANKLGKESPTFTALIESGDRNISSVDLMSLARTFNITIGQLLNEKQSKSPDFMQALRSTGEISERDKQYIAELFRHFKNSGDK